MAATEQYLREGLSRITRGLVVRGVVAIAFGVVVLLWPGISLRALVVVFGAYSAVDGVVALYTAATAAPKGQRWWLVLHGIAGVGVGVMTYLWPGLTALALLYIIGTWAIVLGAVEIIGALSAPLPGGHRLMLGLHGALGIAFGVIMWWRPGAGALALIALIAAFAIVTGVTLIAVAIQLRERSEAVAATLFPPSADVGA